MNQKSFLVWIGALIVIIIVNQIYKKVDGDTGEPMDVRVVEQQLAKAISISEKINNDDNLSPIQKKAMQSEVDMLLHQVRNWAGDMDERRMAYTEKLQQINTQVHQKELDALLQTVLGQWKENNITMDEQLLPQVKSYWQDPSPVFQFSKAYVTAINKAISQTDPTPETPQWLNEIDTFFSQQQNIEGENFQSFSRLFSKQYAILLTLASPLVSFDQIIQMKSLDDDSIRSQELNYFTNLNIPRNIDEAEKIYSAIVKLPKKCVLHSMLGIHESDQAFRAQMFMALLLKNRLETESLHDWQKKLAARAPEYLFDYPDFGISNLGASPRPAFYMAYDTHPEIRSMIASRSTGSFLHHLKQIEAYEEEKRKFEQIVSTDMPAEKRSVSMRVGDDQLSLAKLLEEFDILLKEREIPLGTPLNDDQIEKLKAHIAPLELPEAYITLYKWHDGFLSDSYILNLFHPITKNLKEYAYMNEYMESGKWFPLRSYNGDTFWVVDMMHPESSALTYIFLEDTDDKKEYESIEKMITVYMEAMQKKILYFDPKTGEWQIDKDRFEAIKKKI